MDAFALLEYEVIHHIVTVENRMQVPDRALLGNYVNGRLPGLGPENRSSILLFLICVIGSLGMHTSYIRGQGRFDSYIAHAHK